MGVYIFASVFLFVVLMFIVGIFAEKKRTEALKQFADELGLEFFAEEQNDVLAPIQSLKLFSRGRHQRMRNVIVGETEIARIAMFDYRYTTGTGKNKKQVTNTVVSMQADTLGIPNLTMRPENMLDKVGSALGFQDIDFEEHPKFSKLFVLQGENEEAIRHFLDSSLLDFFAEKKGIHFEAQPGAFIYYRRTVKKDKFRQFLEEGYAVYSAVTERLQQSQDMADHSRSFRT